MKKLKFNPIVKQVLADTVTPVSVYLRLRNLYPKSILLESSDYHGNENSYSFICFMPIASFTANNGIVKREVEGGPCRETQITKEHTLHQQLDEFFQSFNVDISKTDLPINGLFGYTNYDAIKYFEKIEVNASPKEGYQVPDVRYCFYKYVVAIDHHKNIISIVENLREGENSQIDYIQHLLVNLNFSSSKFETSEEETSNITDDEYKYMVRKGKEHCYRGDVFQVVLSRQFSQKFEGDDFNVYRSLRSINPSPYLFFFDYGDYRIFGSSPEAQIRILEDKAYIHPIAGTFKRTGNDEQDKKLAEELSKDPKENAEHVMLVDLARNDLSRNADNVVVETYREVQFYSHVIHLVSQVSGQLPENSNLVKVIGESFPAGTLSGAPKHRAMQLIDQYENQNRGYYGGCIGYMGFDRTVNQAIMIRSFLSKDSVLYYQAGAGIVAESKEENELQEVNNKLGALKKAIEMAKTIS